MRAQISEAGTSAPGCTPATPARGARSTATTCARSIALEKERGRSRTCSHARAERRGGADPRRHPRHPRRAAPLRLPAPRLPDRQGRHAGRRLRQRRADPLRDDRPRRARPAGAGRPGRGLLLVHLRPRLPLRATTSPARTTWCSLRRRLEDLEHAVLGEERDNGLFISDGHNADFYGAVRAWCRGATMVEISEQIELSRGRSGADLQQDDRPDAPGARDARRRRRPTTRCA